MDRIAPAIGLGGAVALASDLVLMQVNVAPPHYGLNHSMQLAQRDCLGNNNTSPDGWGDSLELNFKHHQVREWLEGTGGDRHSTKRLELGD